MKHNVCSFHFPSPGLGAQRNIIYHIFLGEQMNPVACNPNLIKHRQWTAPSRLYLCNFIPLLAPTIFICLNNSRFSDNDVSGTSINSMHAFQQKLYKSTTRDDTNTTNHSERAWDMRSQKGRGEEHNAQGWEFTWFRTRFIHAWPRLFSTHHHSYFYLTNFFLKSCAKI